MTIDLSNIEKITTALALRVHDDLESIHGVDCDCCPLTFAQTRRAILEAIMDIL